MVLSVPPLCLQCDVARLPLVDCEGMRLRGGRDFNPDLPLELAPPPPPPLPRPSIGWLPGVLTKGVRLRLRLDRSDDRGRGCWQLVDLEAASEPIGRRLRSGAPDTCAQSKSLFLKGMFLCRQVIIKTYIYRACGKDHLPLKSKNVIVKE